MFKNLTIDGLALIMKALLNSKRLQDMSEVEQCFNLVIQGKNQPMFVYRALNEAIEVAPENCKSIVQQFECTADYLFDAVNAKEIGLERITDVLNICIKAA